MLETQAEVPDNPKPLDTEKAQKVLEELRAKFPGITDKEISGLVAKLKERRLVKSDGKENNGSTNMPHWDKSKYLEPSNLSQFGENRYLRNLDRFAGGAEGEIYEVYDSVLDKVLLAKHANKEWETHRVEQEAKTLAKLGAETRGIPTVYAIVKEGQDSWIIMEKIEGLELSDYLINNPISDEDGLRICTKVVHTLAIAEDMNIMHQDIKPANILINEQGDPIVIDLGMSNTVDDGDLLPGTPFFRAPEIENGKKPSPQSEVYSIGKTLQLVVNNMSDSQTKADLKKILNRATQGLISKRYESVGALLEEIQSIKIQPQ